MNLSATAGDIGDVGLVPGLGRYPERWNGNLLQYSCLGNPMDRGAWWATVHGVTKRQIQLNMSMPANRITCIFLSQLLIPGIGDFLKLRREQLFKGKFGCFWGRRGKLRLGRLPIMCYPILIGFQILALQSHNPLTSSSQYTHTHIHTLKNIYIYLLIWQHWVLFAAMRCSIFIPACGFFSCGIQDF